MKRLNATVSWNVVTVDGEPFLSGSNTYAAISQADFVALEAIFAKVVPEMLQLGKSKAK